MIFFLLNSVETIKLELALTVTKIPQDALRELNQIGAERARTGRDVGTVALTVKGGRIKEDSDRYNNVIDSLI